MRRGRGAKVNKEYEGFRTTAASESCEYLHENRIPLVFGDDAAKFVEFSELQTLLNDSNCTHLDRPRTDDR